MITSNETDKVSFTKKFALSSSAIEVSLNATVDILLNGYGCLYKLIEFVFHSYLLPYSLYGTDISKATRALIQKKHNFKVFFDAFFDFILK